MYSPAPYAFATGIAELPYLAAQALVMVCITYWMVRRGGAVPMLYLHLCSVLLALLRAHAAWP